MRVLDPVGLWQVFREQTAPLSPRSAVSTPQGELSFAALFERGDALAAALARAGVQEGTLVALALPNSLAFVPSLLALLRLSATVALVSPRYRASELASVQDGVRPGCFLTTPGLAGVLCEGLKIGRSSTLGAGEAGEDLALLFPSPSEPGAVSNRRLALVKFTSGSTGVVKAVGLTADNVLAEARNLVATLDLSPEDRILAPVPLFHSYGFDLGVLSMLYSGAHLGIRDGFVPRRTLSELGRRDVSVFLGVPSMYHIFVETLLTDTPDLSRVRYLLSCTAPLRPDRIEAFNARFRAPICQHYGSSETGAVANHVPSAVLERLDSVGRPVENVQVEILDADGRPLPVGAEGEVVVRSEVVAPGYLMGGVSDASRFQGDRYRTGDLGRLDADGFLQLSGRVDQVINVGGFKVSPHEVIQVLEQVPAVREAAVVGVEDALGEEVVYAAVTLKAPTTEREILEFCRSRLSDYKIPRRIEIRDEMPRGPSGKIRFSREEVRA